MHTKTTYDSRNLFANIDEFILGVQRKWDKLS